MVIKENEKHNLDNIPPIIRYHVDFLHYTVREFLLDHYEKQLKELAGTDFDPLMFLCKMTLFLIKTCDFEAEGQCKTADMGIRETCWIDMEKLYPSLNVYARKIEQRIESEETPLLPLLEQLEEIKLIIHPYWCKDTVWMRARMTMLDVAFKGYLPKYIRIKVNLDPGCL